MENQTKKCTRCLEIKSVENFYKQKYFSSGFTPSCKECIRASRKKYYHNNKNLCRDQMKKFHEKNPNYSREHNREYYKKNKDSISLTSKKWREKNQEKLKVLRKKYYIENRESILEKNKEWSHENRQYRLKYEKKWHKENPEWNHEYYVKRFTDDLDFRLRMLFRSRFYKAVSRNSKKSSVLDLIGCSVDELKIHLESQFKPGMSWKNWGNKGWHIDHIKPCASFNLSDLEQQKECFYYMNLQPLWAKDNISKGAKVL